MNKTHGLYGTKLYEVWHHMKQRCDGTLGARATKNYHDRGITYCPEWATYEGFYRDMADSYQEGSHLDRIDNNGNYEPSNCRWVTPKANMRNKRNNIVIEYNGKKRLLIELCEELGVPYSTVIKRYTYYGIKDIDKLFSKANLSATAKKNTPIQPCIVCGTLQGTIDKKSGRPRRKRGMCNTCYQREVTNKKNKD